MPAARLRAGEPVHAGGVTLWPIERVVVRTGGGPTMRWWSASKEPVALVVTEAGAVRALAVDGRRLDLETLLDTVAGLPPALEALRRSARGDGG